MVVTISSNVTATDVAVAQEEVVVDVVVVVVPLLPPDGVWFGGHEPVDAVEYVPIADVDEHTAGTLEAVGSPQE